MALHQGVEEMPQPGQRLVPGGRRAAELTDVFAGQTARNLPELKPALVAPGQKATTTSDGHFLHGFL